MRLEDMQVEVVEVLPAPPSRVWELLTDVERMAGLGPEHAEASWADDRRRVGARFTGVNERWGRRWEVPCTVVASDPPTAFAWEVGDPASPTATWSYRLEPVGGGTRVTQTMRHGPGRSFLRHAVGKDPAREVELVAERADDLAANMRAVLQAAARLL